MRKKAKIPTILGIGIMAIGLAAGVMLIQNTQIFKLSADGGTPPKDIRITNVADSSFTITWTTEKETSGFVAWGESQSSLTRTESDELNTNSFTHSVTIRGLEPQKKYYFKINSDSEDFDNAGIPWEVSLGPTLSAPKDNYIISGNVLTATGTPPAGALVYVSIGGVNPLSTIASENGSWLISLSQARLANLSDYYDPNKNDLIEIFIQAGPLGTSSAQIYPVSARPVPPLILGQVHDFKNLPPSVAEDQLPVSDIEAPDQIDKESRFNLSDSATTPPGSKVTLDSVVEGEIINSTKPEFFGQGPSGAQITITVESDDPISDTAKIPRSGNWQWSPPADLAPGSHKITIKWRDTDGILRTITKNFVVQAAEGPAFVATPSASLTPTPKITPTTTPRATSTASATAKPIPDSGSLTPTILLFGIGFVLLIAGGSLFLSAVKEG